MTVSTSSLFLYADGNSQKNHNNQQKVISSICDQLVAGNRNITGVMIESHINAGRQDVPDAGPKALKHGISITDACVDWTVTVEMLELLNLVCSMVCNVFCEALTRHVGR